MNDFRLGNHEAMIGAVREDVTLLRAEIKDLRNDIRTVNSFVSEVRGGWKTAAGVLVGFGAFLGAVVAFVTNLSDILLAKTP